MAAGALDGLEPIQVCPQGLCASPDGAERAEQVLHAEASRVQLHGVDGEEVPKQQVVTATMNPLRNRLMLGKRAHILRYVESAFLCFAVPINPLG